MKPLRLEFQGINSFSERTVIDFESLTRNGIFGIFGDTGSGKSTVLDCINFALYGRVERSKEKTDIINYNCSSAYVKFTFNMVNCGVRKTYYVERSIKKDKNGTHKAFLYEDNVCIADKATEVESKVVEILGVEAEDFRKCIALPQGEFSQFVKSAPRERLALIERLFSLSRYGDRFKEKIAARLNECEGEYQNLTGRMSAYENISEEQEALLKEQFKEQSARLDGLNKSAKSATKKYSELKELYAKRLELDSVKQKLERLESQRNSIEQLRGALSVLPVCREAVQGDKSVKELNLQMQQLDGQSADKNGEIARLQSRISELENSLKDGNFDSRIDCLTKLSAKYQTCSGKPEKLENLLKLLERKREEYRKEEGALAELKRQKAEADGKVAEFEKRISGVSGEELENFVNVKFKGAILRGEYANMLDYFVNLSARTEMYDDDSKLYSFIQKELKTQIESFKERLLYVKDFNLENVNEQFEVLQKAIKQREEDSEKLRLISQQAADIDGKIKLKTGELASLKKDGVDLRRQADELSQELKAVFGEECKDFIAAEENTARELESVRTEQKKIIAQIDSAKSVEAQSRIDLERFKVQNQNCMEKAEELRTRLNALLKESNFGGIDECIDLTEKFRSVTDAEKEIKEFDENYSACISRVAELSKVDGIGGISEQAVKDAEAEKNLLENDTLNLASELAVTNSKLSDIAVKLKEKATLSELLAAVEKTRNLILQLKEVTKNNKFLEFIANEYLYDISSLASSTLLKLTDGRYFLTYSDKFNVGDNFNCGELRGVNTLSGGETFLVSLSLALALSQTICARSMKSIEFFFLDEGFGTLDSTLVDTVMSALEKLKGSQFIIGVISHVEELKHRIDSKITVIKATESHGSTVQLSF